MAGSRLRWFLVALGITVVWPACGSTPLPRGMPVATTTTTAPTSPAASPITATTASTNAAMTDSTTTTIASATSPTRATTAGTAPTSAALLLPSDGPLVDLRGEPTYLHGANLPWFNWGCDFGCGAAGGASSESVRAAVDTAFARAAAAGMSVVRWWLLPGEPTQIETDASGLPMAIDPIVYTDIDAALELAERHGIDLVFTLFSAPSALPSAWLESDVGRTRLVETLAPLFERYADDPRVHTWQVINEPEWEIWNDVVAEADVRALVTQVAETVHRTSATLVSVGAARLDGLPLWVGTGLDYYTVHWYDPMDLPEWCVPCTTFDQVNAAFGLDAPLVVGEFYAGEDVADLEARLRGFRDRGYAGAWAWSLMPERTEDQLAIDDAVATRFGDELRSATTDSTADD